MLRLGAQAANDILRETFGVVLVDKALDPLDPNDFLTLSKRLGDQLNDVVEELQAPAIRKALNTLDVDWVNLDDAAVSRVVREANKQMLFPNKKIAPRVDAIFSKQGKALIQQSKESAIDKFKLPISAIFGAEDKAVSIFVVSNQANFITDALGKKTNAHSNTVRSIVQDGVTRGLGRRDIAEEIFESFHGKPGLDAFGLRNNKAYFEVVAASFVNRGRTAASIAAFQQAGVEFYIWDSVLDEVTTETCRFMHNKRFSTGQAMSQISNVADNPDDIKTLQPWIRSAFDDNGKSILVAGTGADRFTVATVTQPGLGKVDEVGKYDAKLTDSQLMQGGMSMPPIHGLCRSTVLSDPTSAISIPKPSPGTTVAPAVPPAKAPKIPAPLTAKAEKAALKKMTKMSALDDGVHVYHKFPTDLEPTWRDEWGINDLGDLMDEGKFKVRKPKREDVFMPRDTLNRARLREKIIDHQKTLAAIEADKEVTVLMVKHKGKLHVVIGQEEVAAMRLRGERRITGRVIDLDKLKPKIPTPAIVKPKAAAPTRPVAPPVSQKPHEVILFENTAPARGSNNGGFFRGSDGVNRYVKFYDDPTQAASEHLANQVYRELGLEAPTSQIFKQADGKLAYASDIFEGGKTLSEVGLTTKNATQAMDGFVGDILTGNWDAAGTGLDNMMILRNGKLARIDNGGSFLFRARMGRKPTSVLNQITEWDKFLNGNPDYVRIAQKASFNPIDARKKVIKQITNVTKMETRVGGWSKFVDLHAPDLPAVDRRAIIDMLEKRTALLKQKRAELRAFKPPKKGASVWVEKPVGGVKPRKGITFEDLPERDLPIEFRKLDFGATQEGTTQQQFRARVQGSIDKLSSNERGALARFTEGEYTDIRRSEQEGSPNALAKLIKSGLKKMKAEARTTYRAITGLPVNIAPTFMENEVIALGRGNLGATASTSRTPDIAINWNAGTTRDAHDSSTFKVLFRLNGKTGRSIEGLSSHASELEVLYGRDARFRVTGLSRVRGTERVLMIEAEELTGKELKDRLTNETTGRVKIDVSKAIDDEPPMPPAFVDHGKGRITIRGLDLDEDWPDEITVDGKTVKLVDVHKLTRDELVIALVEHPVLGLMRPWRSVWGVGV